MSHFVSYYSEIRQRLVFVVGFFFVAFLVLFPLGKFLYGLLAEPLVAALGTGTHLIATQLTAPFFVPLKLSLFVAMVLTVPVFFYQLWSFVMPALYQRERRLIWPIIAFSLGLFVAGVAFVYYGVFPLVFVFLQKWVPADVTLMPDMSAYLSFAMQLFFAFGFAFQLPMVVVVLAVSGVVSLEQLNSARRYVIVAAFILGMVLTPPDVLSQVLLALPLWLLFELSLGISAWLVKQPKNH